MMNAKTVRANLSALAAALLLSGCFGGHEMLTYESREEVIVPPAFLTGPIGVLLANPAGFSAQLTVEPAVKADKARIVSGLFLGQGGKLLFSRKGGDRTFIWDTAAHSGWILSEALQGYAPISSVEQFTNITVISEAAGPSSERVNGHPGHEVEIAVASNNGPAARFSLWRASDLNGLPVRVQVPGVATADIIQLTGARRETLAPKLFEPPEGFTKYASAEALADEMFARKARMRSGTSGAPFEKPLTPAPERKSPY